MVHTLSRTHHRGFKCFFSQFLDIFIRKVLITDSVLSSIGAFELMEFKNKISQIDLQHKTNIASYLKRLHVFQWNHNP